MIPFDINKITNEHVKIKLVTTALSGSVSILDEDETERQGKEIFKRIPVPLAVARSFIVQHKLSRYIKPVLASITRYDGMVIAIERHPLGNMGVEKTQGLFGDVIWKSNSEKSIEGSLKAMTEDGSDWYTDGTLVYKFDNENNIEPLSSDGHFVSTPVQAIKLSSIVHNNAETSNRVCLSFVSDSGKVSHSPPIWKNLSGVGDRQLSKMEIDNNDDDETLQFDKIDQFLAVNLNFAIRASKELSNVFGYEIVEPLALDDLMIQLHTVNLPKLSKHIKQTFDVGMRFTNAIAWLIGLLSRTNTIESYKVVRSMLKYLTTKGVYPKKSLQQESIFINNQTVDDIPLMSIEEALTNPTNDDGFDFLTPDNKHIEVSTVGSLYGAD